jgi:uncharacterized phage protein (TIGR02216 family)
MHAGLCLLRLSSDHFWALTPRELFAATGGLAPDVARKGRSPDRADLDALMAAFPDLPVPALPMPEHSRAGQSP